MNRQSLHKRFSSNKFQNGGQNDNPFGIPKLAPPPNNYTTKAQPKGTITDVNHSYAPGTFDTNQASNTYTSDAAPFLDNINPENMYDVDQSTSDTEQGPLTKQETEDRGIMAPDKTPSLSSWDKIKSGAKNAWGDFKDNWQDAATLGLAGVSAGLNYQDDIRREKQFNQSIQKRQSKPVYDYNYMHGRTTSGGTEYQPIVMAQDGAKITKRYNTPEGVGNNVEIENGEFLILPDGSTEIAQGPNHSDSYKADGKNMSGVNTSLPQNTMVFSNHLKPADLHKLTPEQRFEKIAAHLQAGGNFNDLDMGTIFSKKGGSDNNKTFAQIAKRYDNTKYDEILKNPFNKEVDKQTATIMKERNDNVLKQLFRDQQFLNGNSTGEPKLQKGGTTYDVPEGTTIKEAGDKSIKAGDYVKLTDGTIKKVSKIDVNRVKENTKTSVASNYEEGQSFIKNWANQSKDNQQNLDLANAAFERGIKEGTIKQITSGPKKGQYEITGKFRPNGLEEQMALSDVINKSGKGFGTDKYQIGLQTGTEGYSQRDPNTGLRGTGSFVGGFTPQDYEQRVAYMKAKAQGMSKEDAIKLAESQDPKQRAENRKSFMKEIGMNTEGMSDEDLLNDDFYKNRYSDVTKGMEKTFSEGDYRPNMGNDAMSGWEHYDAWNFQGTPMYEDVPKKEEPQNPLDVNSPTIPPKGKYEKTPYDLSQAVPGAYALAQSQEVFPYAIPEVNSPYIKPQTLNIQSELQDIDNMQTAALRSGADPNMAYAMGLDAKQKAFQTKQNYDAEGRWKADATNFDAQLKTGMANAQLFNSAYNDMYATAKSNQSEAKQAALTNLIENRAQYNRDENLKELYHNNFMNSYNWNPKTNSWDVVNPGDIVDYAHKTKPTTGTKTTTATNTNSSVSKTPNTVNTIPITPNQTSNGPVSSPNELTQGMQPLDNIPVTTPRRKSEPTFDINRTNLNTNLPLSMQYGPVFTDNNPVNLLTLPKSMGGAGSPSLSKGGKLSASAKSIKRKK